MKKLFIVFLLGAFLLTGCSSSVPSGAEAGLTGSEPVGLAGLSAEDARESSAAQSEHYAVTAPMFAWFYAEQYRNLSATLMYFGVDPSQPLKNQSCAFLSGGGTWFDYFVKITCDYVTNMLILCEEARGQGLSPDADGLASVSDGIESLRSEAQAYGMSFEEYLRAMASGNPVTEEDVAKCLELTALARLGYKSVTDVSFTDRDFDAYAAANAAMLEGVDCCIYTFYSDSFEGDSAAAEEAAVKLAAAKTADEYGGILSEILAGLGQNEEAIAFAVKDCRLTHASAADLGPEGAEWADAASVGESGIIGESGSSSFCVILLTKAPYRDETKTRSVRHILFLNTTYSDSSKADEVWAEWEAAGFTEEKFTELCAQYSEDPGSNEVGGLYENVSPGQMLEEFDEWLFDKDRKPGDHTRLESLAYGWHFLYYVGESDTEAWKVEAEAIMKADRYDAFLAARKGDVTVDTDLINGIEG